MQITLTPPQRIAYERGEPVIIQLETHPIAFARTLNNATAYILFNARKLPDGVWDCDRYVAAVDDTYSEPSDVRGGGHFSPGFATVTVPS
jgi:hypothetical protein